MEKNKKIAVIAVFGAVMVFGIVFASNPEKWLGNNKIRIETPGSNESINVGEGNGGESAEEEKGETNPLNGTRCENYNKRPIAIMMAGDLEAWPLSGISEADMVIEMPVMTGGITRFMAVFVCGKPEEVGSIRSARHDFIPLAMGLDAIFAHWGGSHFALDKLNNKIMDNINALYLDGSVFYRKPGFPKPHDGFTTMERLNDYSQRMEYRMENQFEGYKFYEKESPAEKDGVLTIGYPSVFEVEYKYKSESNSYFREKGQKKDIDRLTSKQITAKNVVIMYAASRQLEPDYNDMEIEGEGNAIIYQNGREIKGTWKKDKTDMKSRLYFYNEAGEEAKFVPGPIWIQVVQPNQSVKWNIEK